MAKNYKYKVSNENTIGYNGRGDGSNSITLGDDNIVKTILKGNVGIGTTSPNAYLHFKAGTTTIAPLKLTDGDLLVIPKEGTIEYSDNIFYLQGGDGLNIGSLIDYAEIKSNGSLEFHGTARNVKQVQVNLGSIRSSTTRPPTTVEKGLDGSLRYSDTSDNTTSTTLEIRNDTDRTEPIQYTKAWSSPSTTGTCRWMLEYKYVGVDTDMDDDTADGTIYVDASPAVISDGLVITEFTLPAPADTDLGLQLRLTRVASDVLDTLGDFAYVYGGSLHYTSYKI